MPQRRHEGGKGAKLRGKSKTGAVYAELTLLGFGWCKTNSVINTGMPLLGFGWCKTPCTWVSLSALFAQAT